MSTVFLTGATGLIGGALLAALRERGEEVRALVRSQDGAEAVAARGAAPVRGDLRDEDALARGMAGCDLLFHVAGVNTLCPRDPAPLYEANVAGAEAAVRAAGRAGVPRAVLTSSAAVLGEAPGTVGREDSPHRGAFLSHYERSKHLGERAALAEAQRAGVPLVCVNPASVQGPGRAQGTGRILLAHLNGRLRAFVETTISLIDVRDCTQGHLLAAERGRPGERYVLCGAVIAARDALAEVGALTGVTEEPRLLPGRVALAAGGLAEAVARARGRTPPVCRAMVRTLLHGHRYDGGRAALELGLRYTPVRETFRATIAWALAEGLITRPLPGWRPDPIDRPRPQERA